MPNIYYDTDKAGNTFPIPYAEGVKGDVAGIQTPTGSNISVPDLGNIVPGYEGQGLKNVTSGDFAKLIDLMRRSKAIDERGAEAQSPQGSGINESPVQAKERFIQSLIKTGAIDEDPRFVNLNQRIKDRLKNEDQPFFQHIFGNRFQYGQPLPPEAQKHYQQQLKKLEQNVTKEEQDKLMFNSRKFVEYTGRFEKELKYKEEQEKEKKAEAEKKTAKEEAGIKAGKTAKNKGLQDEYKALTDALAKTYTGEVKPEMASRIRARMKEILKELSPEAKPEEMQTPGIKKPDKVEVPITSKSIIEGKPGALKNVTFDAKGNPIRSPTTGKGITGKGEKGKGITGEMGKGVRGNIPKNRGTPPIKGARWSDKYQSWVAKDREGNWRMVE